MEIARYAMVVLLAVGCSAPNIDRGAAEESNSDSLLGAGEQAYDWQEVGSELAGKRHAHHAPAKPKKRRLSVDFEHCSEFAGLTFVPTENVRDLVPTHYQLAHFTTSEEAVVVVRVVDCKAVRVQDGPKRKAIVAQVGVTLAGPDATADLNNYTLWYVTDNRALSRELSKLGVAAEHSLDLDYDFSPRRGGTGPFNITVSADQAPDFVLTGTATKPSQAAVPFVASWWDDTFRGQVQMRTTLPRIKFGQSVMSLTAFGPALQDILGTGPVTFPGLDSYNTFDRATMVVKLD